MERLQEKLMIAIEPSLDDRVDDLIHHQRAPHILLAEDDPYMRELIAGPLREDGYELIEAASGVELLRTIHRFESTLLPPCLVITDVRMPGFSGLEVLEYFRDVGIRVPVIVMTAFGDDETHARARELDARIVLDKPFEIDDLRAAVASVLPRPESC